MSNFPYIGCKISLISKHGIRYQGVLFSIHAEDHTICLNSVRCFGTEGRRAKDGLPEVPAAQDVFEYIVFRGSDIQDLTVCEATTPSEAPADPAIVSTNQAPAGAPPVSVPAVPAPKPAGSPKGGRAEKPPAPRPRGAEQRPAGNGSLEGTGAYSMTRKAKPADGEAWKAPTEEFDFAKGLDTFDKSQLSSEFEDKLELDEGPGNFYQKSSFFDNISCDATDRESSEEDRKNKGFAEMRKLDLETFGETFGRSHFRYRGKGGGKGGGGQQQGGKGGRNRRRNRGGQGQQSSNN